MIIHQQVVFPLPIDCIALKFGYNAFKTNKKKSKKSISLLLTFVNDSGFNDNYVKYQNMNASYELLNKIHNLLFFDR